MKTITSMFLALALFLVLIPRAFALPTVHDIYEADQRGDFRSAESMTRQVLAAMPNSAKAHYIYACVLADEHKLDPARAEFAKAESIDPTDGFANAPSVQRLRSILNPPQMVTHNTTQSSNSDSDIWLVLGIVVLGLVVTFIIVAVVNSRETVVVSNGSSGVNTYGGGRGPSTRPYYGGGSTGPVIVNNSSNDGFVTGMVVGEALSGNRGNETIVNNETVVNNDSGSNQDFGAGGTSSPEPAEQTDFGTSSDSGSSSSDFGTSSDSGSSDFGSSSDSGSSSDFGSGSDSGGGSDFGSGGDSGGGNGW